MYRINSEELYILSCGKGRGLETEVFSKAKNVELRGLKTHPTKIRNPHNQQLGYTWLIIAPLGLPW